MSAYDDSARNPLRPPARSWAAESPFVGEAAEEQQAPIHPWYRGQTPFVEGREPEETYAPEAEGGSDPAALEAESPFQIAFEQPCVPTAGAEMQRAEAFEDEFALEETGIIDGDNRVRVKKTDGVPWRWICKIAASDSQNQYYAGGTGVLISDRHVLTAAHVVYPRYVDPYAYSAEVIPALDGGDEPFGTYPLSGKIRIPKNYDPKAQDHLDWDYALVTLKDRVGEKTSSRLGGGPLCYWGHPTCGANTIFVRPEPRTLNGKAVLTAGYPHSKGFEPRRGGTQLWCAAGMLHSADRRRRKMGITADTTKGQSGSPVWLVENGRYCLVGIAVGAGPQTNSVVRVTRELIRQLRAWITEDGETPSIVETEEALESPALRVPYPAAEHYSLARWSPEPPAEQAEDFAGVDHEEEIYEQPVEERFDPSAVPKDVVDALRKKDWPLALKLAIQAGWRDENELTNLVFFQRHQELPPERLDPKGPQFKQLSAEWTKILEEEVWKAIEVSAENVDLVVSGAEVTDHHRRFFQRKSGKRLKKLIEDAAREVDLNPGLLGTIMMAETRRPLSYLSSEQASSYHIGADDFYEGRAAIQARVPAYAKIKWDKNQTPSEHLNDAKTNPRIVKTILFDSGPDAVLATAVYVKFREVRLREIAAESKGDFDKLPLATRFALSRMAMAAGTAGATPFLRDALRGVDIFVRQAIPVRAYQTKRNATVRTAQAMHLSDWIFGVPVPSAAAQPELETFEDFHGAESSDDELEDEGFEGATVGGEADVSEGGLDLEHLGIVEFQVAPPPPSPTLGFEFDLNFGFERKVTDAKGLSPPAGFEWPSEALKVTDHEWKDLGGRLKDALVVTLDAVRMEIATVPFHIDSDAEFAAVVDKVTKFGQELIDAKKTQERSLDVPGVGGHPTTFEHPRTVVNKPEVDAHGNIKFPGDRDHASYTLAPVPLVIHRVSNAYPAKTGLWSSPQATVTLPLAEFGKLVWEIHRTKGDPPGVAFTGRDSDRLGVRDDLAWLALTRAMADRKKKLGTSLSDGTKVTDADFTRTITSLVTILLMYMLTSIMRDDRDQRKEQFAKGSLPLNVKTPLWEIHKFALTDREKFVLHELYTDPGKRKNLFVLASGQYGGQGVRKLFPDYTHADAERFLGTSPTWDTLVDALVKEKPVIVTEENRIAKKGHLKGDEILIAPLSSKIGWAKTKPRIAVEMRRMGFDAVGFAKWPGLMKRVRELAKKVNP